MLFASVVQIQLPIPYSRDRFRKFNLLEEGTPWRTVYHGSLWANVSQTFFDWNILSHLNYREIFQTPSILDWTFTQRSTFLPNLYDKEREMHVNCFTL